MVNYPQTYHAEALARPGIKGSWENMASEHTTECSIPAVYQGSGEAFSPEEFFLLSLQNCFIASFKVYAEHKHLAYEKISVSADLIVDNHQGTGPVMESVEMNISLSGVEDQALARELVDRSIQDGFIFNSIKTSVTQKLDFN
ncbi:MAG TPA: OsmC family protein [Bacteriovoracaceae bacterium]|nr:OsmC family protein [Bacteriovoracaceae bacterium]